MNAPASSTDAEKHGPHFPDRRLWWNWITLAGLAVFTIGVVVSLFLFVVEYNADHANVYLSLITFAAMPGVVLPGLGLMGLGVWREFRRRSRDRATYAAQIDLHRRADVKMLVVLLTSASVCGGLSIWGAYHGYEFTESTAFCGEVCHEVMHPEYTAHQQSPHAKVHCTTCHVGPGIQHFVEAKINGLHQVKAVLTDTYSRPIKTPLRHLRPADEICEQCHWPDKFHGQKLEHYVYFLPDEKNTRMNLTLLLHVGGGDPKHVTGEGLTHSVHWHVSGGSKVYYLATDERRQQIPWVKVVSPDGKETVYMDESAEASEEDLLAKQEIRELDCLDCHNRSVHQFNIPQRTLNIAMMAGDIDPAIPSIKAQALAALVEKYPDEAAAEAGIREGLNSYYQEEHPDVLKNQGEALSHSIDTIVGIYQQTFFPRMDSRWDSHPDNIGHTFSRGCFRCHAGLHESADGKKISHKCEVCHDIVSQAYGDNRPPLGKPEEFQHPEDISEMWKEVLCTECHTGGGTGM